MFILEKNAYHGEVVRKVLRGNITAIKEWLGLDMFFFALIKINISRLK